MTNYANLKNAELEALLKERSLPHTGKKAEMVSRLQDDDKQKEKSTSTALPTTAPKPEVATSAPAAAAVAAGGQGRVANPVAVPNQVVGEDPAKTSDLTVTETASGTTATAPAVSGSSEAPKAATESIYTSNLPATDLEIELEKRKARAKKFGIVEKEADNDTIKALERAKKFGTINEGETAALGAKLDAALPERGQRKRVRGGAEGDATQESKRRRGSAAAPAPSAPRGAASGGGRGDRKPSTGGGQKAAGWMSKEDREAAEKRKGRFAASD